MANTATPRAKGKPRDHFVVIPQGTLQHNMLKEMLTRIADAKKPVEVKPAEATEMLRLLEDGGTFVSYDAFERKEDSQPDLTKPLKDLGFGAVWLGRPETEGKERAEAAKILVDCRASSGKGGNAITVTRKGKDGREYWNVVGVKPSAWALNDDNETFQQWKKEKGFKAPSTPESSAKESLPVGTQANAPSAEPFDG